MAGITLEIAESRLAAYLDAEEKLLTGHASAKIGDKEYRKSELSQIQAGIALWQARCQGLAAVSNRTRFSYGVPT